VRRRPYSVLLLDEIEKAHPDVFNILLQILDDGRLTDSQGRTVDFRNTVIIMTSNIGSPYILEHATADWGEVEAQVLAALRAALPSGVPQPCGRRDRVSPVGEEQIGRIIELQLHRLERLLAERKLTITLTPEARRAIAVEGYEPAYGARPLKRALQRMVQNPLALGVLEGKFQDGDHILVAAGPGRYVDVRGRGTRIRCGSRRRRGAALGAQRACSCRPTALTEQ